MSVCLYLSMCLHMCLCACLSESTVSPKELLPIDKTQTLFSSWARPVSLVWAELLCFHPPGNPQIFVCVCVCVRHSVYMCEALGVSCPGWLVLLYCSKEPGRGPLFTATQHSCSLPLHLYSPTFLYSLTLMRRAWTQEKTSPGRRQKLEGKWTKKQSVTECTEYREENWVNGGKNAENGW